MQDIDIAHDSIDDALAEFDAANPIEAANFVPDVDPMSDTDSVSSEVSSGELASQFEYVPAAVMEPPAAWIEIRSKRDRRTTRQASQSRSKGRQSRRPKPLPLRQAPTHIPNPLSPHQTRNRTALHSATDPLSPDTLLSASSSSTLASRNY